MATRRERLLGLLAAVRSGAIALDDAVERIADVAVVDLGFARADTDRETRQRAPEAVLGEGKTVEQVAAIVTALVESGAGSVMVTRASDEARAAVRTVYPEALEHVLARAVWVARSVPPPAGRVVLVSAGTSDGPVLHEARIRAELLGADVLAFEDCGVAGLHRLEPIVPELRGADCVVVCAGMDGALASVVGGLVACPVIGVPTSVGYGSARGGETALHAMLASCAAGLAVVGIDDGLGAGTIAARIARAAAGADRPRTSPAPHPGWGVDHPPPGSDAIDAPVAGRARGSVVIVEPPPQAAGS